MDTAVVNSANLMQSSKRHNAHSYITSKCDVSLIEEQLEMVEAANYEGFVLKAASQVFTRVFPAHDANLARIEPDGVRFY